MSIAGSSTRSRISASRIPLLRRVIIAATRSETKVSGNDRIYPTAFAQAIRPEFIWDQLYGGATMRTGKV